MKHLIASSAILLFAATFVYAQNDSTTISIQQETGLPEKQRFIDRYDYVFGVLEPARFLFKWDAASMLPVLGINADQSAYTRAEASVALGAEVKISPAFSLNASYQFGLGQNFGTIFSIDDPSYSHIIRLEPRWYFGMPRRIRKGLSANNFSGNYFGLELLYAGNAGKKEAQVPRRLYQGAALRFGIQRRLFRYGYFDMSYGVGLRDYPATVYHRGATNLFADARLAVGLALSTPKPGTRASSGYCDVLQCFREEKRMFKIDLFNLLRVASTDQAKSSARFAWEEKIAGSPFSIEAQVIFDGAYSNYKNFNQTVLKAYNLGFGGHIQGRYYYGLQRRIARGQSGNNLSGAYVGLQVDWRQNHGEWNQRGDFPPYLTESTSTQTTAGVAPVWGIQYRLFRRGFIDFNLGAGWGTQKTTTNNNGQTSAWHEPRQLHLVGGLRIGLAF